MNTLDTDKALLVKKRGGGVREIPRGKWYINRNTPVGEPADVWERMPYEGRRYVDWDKIIGNK